MANPAAIRRKRGTILRIVRDWGPAGISYDGLLKILHQAGLDAAIDSLEENVDYLAEQGLLTKKHEEDRLTMVERWVLRITPAGIDLLIGIRRAEEFPGVEIVC